MTKELAISVRGIGKRYRRPSAVYHNSLRDMVAAGVADLFASKQSRADKQAREMFWALEDVSFDVAKGENVGIIGLNGAGKSTLLKILSRITTPTTGHADIEGRLGALLEVGTGFHGELTGRENVYLYGSILGMTHKEVAAKYDAIVEFAELADFMETPVKRYSSGMYVRLAFAVAAHLDPDILLLDEVLAVGDFAFQRKCMAFARALEKNGKTILFVSHNMFSIKTMCERVIYLKDGRVEFDGPTDIGLKRYEDDSKLQTLAWFNDETRNPSLFITEMEFLSDDGQETTLFDHGAPMRMRLRYRASRRIERPDFRISIRRSDDLHCATFSTSTDGVDIPFVEGEGEIELRTPPLKLTAELYSTNIVVRERDYGPIIAAQVGPSFHVRHPLFAPLGYGVFHEPGEWRVRSGASEKLEASDGIR